jgi:HEAT repeat protein
VSSLAASIERALRSEDAEERRQATAEIGALPAAAAAPLLLVALGDDDWRVRKEATIAARGLGAAPSIIRALLTVLAESDNVGLRNAAVEVLANFGAAATPELADAFARLDADGRKLVVETLGKGRDPGALDALEKALDDGDDNVRQGAAEAISGLGPLARERVTEVLLRRLDDRDRVVTLTALEGLRALEVAIPWARLGPLVEDPTLRTAALAAAALAESPEAARALVGVIGGARGSAFEQALRALARLAEGPLAGAVAEALAAGGPEVGRRLVAASLPAGGGDDATPRRATALLLAAAARAPGVVDVAVNALGEDALVEAARRALVTLGAPALPEIVARLSRDAPAEARAALIDVVSVLAATAPEAPVEALAALRSAVHDAEHRVAVRALSAVSRLGGAGDLTLLAEQTCSDRRPVAAAAEGALSALSARFPAAARALADRFGQDERTLLPAAIALGAAAGSSPFAERDAAFLAHAATAGDTSARRAAVHAVAEIRAAAGAAFAGAIEVLRIALADEEHEVQLAAARALGRLCTAREALPASEVLDMVDRSGEADLVAATVRAIGEGLHAGDAAPRAAADLVPALGLFARGAPSPVALAAVEALGQAQRAGVRTAVPALTGALDHADEAVVKATLLKLAGAAAEAEPAAVEALTRGLSHAGAGVRVLAVELLADAQPEEARRWLLPKLVSEPDRRVKEAIRRALGPSIAPERGEGG